VPDEITIDEINIDKITINEIMVNIMPNNRFMQLRLIISDNVSNFFIKITPCKTVANTSVLSDHLHFEIVSERFLVNRSKGPELA
jgi:hypothetical protein